MNAPVFCEMDFIDNYTCVARKKNGCNYFIETFTSKRRIISR